VRDACAASGVDRVVVSSVANEYSGYVTTPDEYARQHYEGGHTLYGPSTLPFLAAHAGRLAGEVAVRGDVDDALAVRRFSLRVHRYLARAEPGAPIRRVVAPPVFRDPTARDDARWEVVWRDVAPGGLAWHEPLVRVDARDGSGPWRPARRDGRPVDDQGWDMGVAHVGRDDLGDLYVARWYDPDVRAGRRHRFVLLAQRGRPEVWSAPFD